MQHLIRLMADMRLLKAFANASAEILGYIETTLRSYTTNSSANATTTTPSSSTTASLNSGVSVNGAFPSTATTSTSTVTSGVWAYQELQEALRSQQALHLRNPFQEVDLPVAAFPTTSSTSQSAGQIPPASSTNQHLPQSKQSSSQVPVQGVGGVHNRLNAVQAPAVPSWPAQEDSFLNSLLLQFALQVEGSAPTGASAVGGNARNVILSAPLWSTGLLSEQIGLLWVMHLRAHCSLRGVRPSEVLGYASLLLNMETFAEQYAQSVRASSRLVSAANASSVLNSMV